MRRVCGRRISRETVPDEPLPSTESLTVTSPCGRESSGSGSSGNLGAQGSDVSLMPWQVLGRVSDPLKRT